MLLWTFLTVHLSGKSQLPRWSWGYFLNTVILSSGGSSDRGMGRGIQQIDGQLRAARIYRTVLLYPDRVSFPCTRGAQDKV